MRESAANAVPDASSTAGMSVKEMIKAREAQKNLKLDLKKEPDPVTISDKGQSFANSAKNSKKKSSGKKSETQETTSWLPSMPNMSSWFGGGETETDSNINKSNKKSSKKLSSKKSGNTKTNNGMESFEETNTNSNTVTTLATDFSGWLTGTSEAKTDEKKDAQSTLLTTESDPTVTTTANAKPDDNTAWMPNVTMPEMPTVNMPEMSLSMPTVTVGNLFGGGETQTEDFQENIKNEETTGRASSQSGKKCTRKKSNTNRESDNSGSAAAEPETTEIRQSAANAAPCDLEAPEVSVKDRIKAREARKIMEEGQQGGTPVQVNRGNKIGMPPWMQKKENGNATTDSGPGGKTEAVQVLPIRDDNDNNNDNGTDGPVPKSKKNSNKKKSGKKSNMETVDNNAAEVTLESSTTSSWMPTMAMPEISLTMPTVGGGWFGGGEVSQEPKASKKSESRGSTTSKSSKKSNKKSTKSTVENAQDISDTPKSTENDNPDVPGKKDDNIKYDEQTAFSEKPPKTDRE